MGFVTELISKEDFEKYKISDVRAKFVVGATRSSAWAIDRERDMFLLKVTAGREERADESGWVFYWDKSHIFVLLGKSSVSQDQDQDKQTESRARIIRMSILGSAVLQGMEDKKAQLVGDLEEALSEYRWAGIFASRDVPGFKVVLEGGDI